MKIDTVWKKNGENEEQVPISTVKEGDFVVFRDGAMITFDGVVVSGQASVNEASMTCLLYTSVLRYIDVYGG